MFKKFLRFLRIINKKTFDIQIFLIPTHIRAKVQIFLFCFFPQLVSYLSIKSAKLPSNTQKFKSISKNLDEFIVLNKRNFNKKKIDFFIRSKKNDYSNLRNKNVFLLNPLYIENETKKRISNQKDMKLLKFNHKRFIYVTSEHTILKIFIKNNLNVLFIQIWKNDGKKFYMDKWEKPIYRNVLKYCKNRKNSFVVDVSYNTTCTTHYTSSAIAGSSFFAKVCNKVNIYNWDFYMKENPKSFNFFKLANLLYPLDFRLKNNVFLETSLWHWYFIFRISKLKTVSVDGYLKYIASNKKIIKRLKKIFCR